MYRMRKFVAALIATMVVCGIFPLQWLICASGVNATVYSESDPVAMNNRTNYILQDTYGDDVYDTLYIYGSNGRFDIPHCMPTISRYNCAGFTEDSTYTWDPEIKENIKTVIIAEGLDDIGIAAFEGFTNLRNVSLPSTTYCIYPEAFAYCSSLEEITIPASVASVGDYCFYASDLYSITFEGDATNTSFMTFVYCIYLREINMNCRMNSYLESLGNGFVGDLASCLNISHDGTNISCAGCRGTDPYGVPTDPYIESTNQPVTPIPSYYDPYIEPTYQSVTPVPSDPYIEPTDPYIAPTDPYLPPVDSDEDLYNEEMIVGSLGDNISFVLTEDGILDIVGTGPMYDFSGEISNPLSDKYIKTVNIGSGITTIADSLFYGQTHIRTVSIPSSVTSIGSNAFYNCELITGSLDLSSVTEIGAYAFGLCYKLEGVTLGDNLTSLGECAFRGCESITTINLPDSLTTIPDGVFENCHSLNSVNLPAYVVSIGNSAFRWCESLTSIVFPNSLEEIEDMAFECCGSLRTITFATNDVSIGEDAFRLCSSVKTVSVPCNYAQSMEELVNEYSMFIVYSHNIGSDGVCVYCGTDIFESDFEGQCGEDVYYCLATSINDNGESINVLVVSGIGAMWDYAYIPGSDRFTNPFQDVEIDEIIINDGITYIGNYAFAGCKATSVHIPESIRSIASNCFHNCINLEFIYCKSYYYSGSYVGDVVATCPNIKTIYLSCCDVDGSIYRDTGLIESVHYALAHTYTDGYFCGDCRESDITFPSCGHHIDIERNGRCDICDNYISRYFNEYYSCGEYLSYALWDTDGDGVKETLSFHGSGEFYDDLEAYGIDFSTFEDVTTVILGPSDYTIPDHLFENNVNLQTVIVTDITSVDPNYERTDATLRIGEYAFANCPNLTTVVFSEYLRGCADTAFAGCNSLTEIRIPCKYYDSYISVFAGFEDQIVRTHRSGEYNWSDIYEERVEPTCTSNGYVRRICGACDTVIESQSKILNPTGHNIVAMPELESTCIEHGHSAYRYCAGCDRIFGTYTEYPLAPHSFNGEYCEFCGILYYASNPDVYTQCGDNVFFYIFEQEFDGEIERFMEVVGSGPMWDYTYDSETGTYTNPFQGVDFDAVWVNEDITYIGDYAFAGSRIEGIVFLSDTLELGDCAFENCEQLESVNIHCEFTSIGQDFFESCPNLGTVVVPCGLTLNLVDEYAYFENLGVLILIHTRDYECSNNCSVCTRTNIATDAHTDINADGICDLCGEEVDPNVILPIRFACGANYDYVNCVIYDTDDDGIRDEAYIYGEGVVADNFAELLDQRANRDDLVSVVFGDRITNVPAGAFAGCDNLVNVILKDDVTSIGDGAFANCPSLTNVTMSENIEYCSDSAFDGCDSLVAIYVPCSNYEYFASVLESYESLLTRTHTDDEIANGVYVEAVDATCTYDGHEEGYVCPVCGDVLSGCEAITAIGHTAVVDEAVEATCTTDGCTAGSHCSTCGMVFTPSVVIPATGHTEVVDEAVAATCIATGLTEGSHCSVCGEILVAQEIVPATGHSEVVDEAVAATCIATGLTEGSHCSVCDEILVAQEVVPATGHTEVVDEAIAATCIATGLTEGSHCSVCDEILVAQNEIPMTDHTYSDDRDATCDICGFVRVVRESEGWHRYDDGWHYIDANGDSVTGWNRIQNEWYYFNMSGVMTTGWSKIGGQWYYFKSSGAMVTGWYAVDRIWYYFTSSGAMATGWTRVDNDWFYFDPSGAMAVGWQQIDRTWYYFEASGLMVTGLKTIGTSTYYFGSSGAMATGWQKINNVWYYFRTSGAMSTGWERIGSSWYYFSDSGIMATGWQKVDGEWYYFNTSGSMVTGWLKIGNNWYYFNASGSMATGWQKVDGKWYYFYPTGSNQGVMAVSTVIDGYTITASGAMA